MDVGALSARPRSAGQHESSSPEAGPSAGSGQRAPQQQQEDPGGQQQGPPRQQQQGQQDPLGDLSHRLQQQLAVSPPEQDQDQADVDSIHSSEPAMPPPPASETKQPPPPPYPPRFRQHAHPQATTYYPAHDLHPQGQHMWGYGAAGGDWGHQGMMMQGVYGVHYVAPILVQPQFLIPATAAAMYTTISCPVSLQGPCRPART